MERVDPKALGKAGNYFLMTSMLVPRPIGWLGTRDAEGVDNLEPFSYFMGVSSEPALVALSVARGRRGALKDSARNLLDRQEGTLSVVSADLLQAMHQTSAPYPPEVSEFDAAGLTAVAAHTVAACFVGEARAAMEVKVHDVTDYGSTHLFVLEVLAYHVREELLADGRATGLDAVARLGGSYATLGEQMTLPRPSTEG